VGACSNGNQIIVSELAGAGISAPVRLDNQNIIVRPRFRADFWTGNLDLYRFSSNGLQQHTINVVEVYYKRNLTRSPRALIAGHDPDGDGITTQAAPFSIYNASLFATRLFSRFPSQEPISSLAAPLQSRNVTAAQLLINFTNGMPQSGLRIRDRDGNGGNNDFGDFVSSKPVIATTGGMNQFDNLVGYREFVQSQNNTRLLALIGGNDGILHAFDAQNGNEVWGYIPSTVVPHLERLARVDYNTNFRRSFVDGQITVRDAFIGGSWRTIAFFGLGESERAYVVLDITNRVLPTLLGEVIIPVGLGDSSTHPELVVTGNPSESPSRYQWWMVVGSGASGSASGTSLAVFNLNSLSSSPIIIPVSRTAPVGTRTSGVRAVQSDINPDTDRLYLADEAGDVFRIHTVGYPTAWTVSRLFAGDANHPISTRPVAVLVENPNYNPEDTQTIPPLAIGVYWGTGRWRSAGDVRTMQQFSQEIVGILDPLNTGIDNYQSTRSGVQRSQLVNQQLGNISGSLRKSARGAKVFQIPQTASGFIIPLALTSQVLNGYYNPAGFVIDEALNVGGAILMPTVIAPPDNRCVGAELEAFLLPFDARSGAGVLIDSSKPEAGIFVNGALPDGATNITTAVQQGIAAPLFDLNAPFGELSENDVRIGGNHVIQVGMIRLGSVGLAYSPFVVTAGGSRLRLLFSHSALSSPSIFGNSRNGFGNSGVASFTALPLNSFTAQKPEQIPWIRSNHEISTQ
jgi:Tfp pilus tip-associated adhesin PilY1